MTFRDPMELASRKAWSEWTASRDGWHWFVTLTFGAEVSEEVALRALKTWSRNVAARLFKAGHVIHPSLVYVLDEQPDGRPHFHVLCAFGGLDLDPELARQEWRALRAQFPTGYIDAQRCSDADSTIRYLFKHGGERGLGNVCHRLGACKHRSCKFGVSPWPKAS